MLHLISTMVLVVIAVGLYYRKSRNLHWRLMASAFGLDLGLVLYIEFSRAAVEKVVSEGKAFVWFHAGISLAVIALYVVMLGLGRTLLLNTSVNRGMATSGAAIASKDQHRNVGIAFCVLRILNYVTALLM